MTARTRPSPFRARLPLHERLACALAGFALACCLDVSTTGSQAQSANDDLLYRQFGERAGLVALIDDFSLRLNADPRTRPFVQDVDMRDFKPRMVTQFCELTGGPCTRAGRDVNTVHRGPDIARQDAYAVIEVLQAAMDARGIPLRSQSGLLAKLAPMQREMIDRP